MCARDAMNSVMNATDAYQIWIIVVTYQSLTMVLLRNPVVKPIRREKELEKTRTRNPENPENLENVRLVRRIKPKKEGKTSDILFIYANQ